jgi:hypothetical protein
MWYGGVGSKTKKAITGATPDFVKKNISASERDINAWIEKYGRSVKGTVDALEEGDGEYPDPDISDDENSDSDGGSDSDGDEE